MNNQTIDTLLGHRSVRRFKPQDVSPELLADLVECGLRASNTGNMQLYSVIATTREPLRGELCKLHFGQCATAPLWLTVCTDVARYHQYCRVNGCDEPYGNLLWFTSALVDAALCAQNICVAAEAQGLGFCYLGTVNYNTRQIAELLQCPKGVVPVIAIAMPYLLQASITLSSLIEPPGWAIYFTPLFFARSILSPNGKKASLPNETPSTLSKNSLFSFAVKGSGRTAKKFCHTLSPKTSSYSSEI